MEIAFRPHHFLCALCFRGSGYSSAFVTNFQKIMNQLNTHPNLKIKVTSITDSICAPCPHRNNTLCATQDKIVALDTAHADALKLNSNEEFTWQEAKDRIASHISMETFHRICSGCSWKESGVCEQVLKDFLI